ncbi:MAG TPA: 50S ribosomal protein L18, partial [Candidatus Deferrimicrobiaceae bacterium]|nr:50S ribosomal protein L18 [Candidatus Deferrimicrobiaceae bacterium]
MAKGASYRVKLRRRREGKTDYQARKAMVICSRPRLVTRPSIRNINAQIIVAKQKGDLTLVAASSHELVKKYGWKAPTGNIPAAYLTGMLVGLRAKAKGINEAILDLGLINPTKGSRVFAVLHGAIDAGVEIPHGEEKIVKDRAKGDHIAYYAKSLSGEQEEYAAKFSQYTAKGLAPEKVAQHFSEVRVAIIGSFKDAKVAPEPPSAAAPKVKAPPKPAP